MDLELTPAQVEFRRSVRSFIDANLVESMRMKLRLGHAPSRSEIVEWHRKLNRRGWAAPHWPGRFGGSDLGVIEKVILQEELYRAPAPQPLSFNVTMLGPVLMRFGSQAMQQEWLPKLANLDVWFCQGFSEPASGSDLASLRTSATREGDSYRVNGQKIWTTTAHWADWIFCLVRTSKEERRQAGISMLLIDLKSPGISIRPIKTIDGQHHFNEVFFDNVSVPVGNLVGEEGRGWECTRFLLGNERTLIAKVGYCYERLDWARQRLQQAQGSEGTRKRLQDEEAILRAETRALEIIQWRMLALDAADSRAGALASVLKLKGTAIQQRIAALLCRIDSESSMALQELNAAPPPGTAGSYYHYVRAVTIYGGSSEIQRELLSRELF